MDARLEQIFREESRSALGAERMTAERLMYLIAEFPITAPPEEVALFTQFIRGLASGLAQTAPEAPTAAPEPSVPASPSPAPVAAQRRTAGPFRASYPAPAPRPPAVAPAPIPAPELDDHDDIEDFTDSASETGS